MDWVVIIVPLQKQLHWQIRKVNEHVSAACGDECRRSCPLLEPGGVKQDV